MVVAASLVAEVKISGDAEAKKKLGSVGESVDKTSHGFHDMLGNALSFAGGIGVFDLASNALGYLKEQFSGVFQESMDAQDELAQTNKVLQTTHDASGETADAIVNLAGSFSHLTKFTDDQVQIGENLLLTFTNIGKNVFPQATQTMLDLSQAMGQDVKSSAIQLGKALNDPLTGMTALQRVGVTFDDTEKKLIKTYMAHNELAKAQGVILKELQKEFGGSAQAAGKTFGGQMAILNQRIDDVKQTIGDALLPVVTKFTGFLSAEAMPILNTFADWFAKSGFPALEQFAGGIYESTTQSAAFHTVLSDVENDLSLVGSTALTLAGDVETFVGGIVDAAEKSGAFQSVLQLIQDILPDVANFLTEAGSAIDSNLLPPLESLVTNVGLVVSDFATWLDKSGTAKSAIADLGTAVVITSQVVGTLVQGVSDLVGWFEQGSLQTQVLAGVVAGLGAAFIAIKIADTVSGFQQMFAKLQEGDGIISNLAGKFKDKLSSAIDDFLANQAPNLKASMDGIKVSAEEAATAEETVAVAPAEGGAAGWFANLEKSLAGVGTAAETSAGEVAVASTEMEASLEGVGTAAGTAEGEIAAVGTTSTAAGTGVAGLGVAAGAAALPILALGAIFVATYELIKNKAYDTNKSVTTSTGEMVQANQLRWHQMATGANQTSQQIDRDMTANMNNTKANVVAAMTDMQKQSLAQGAHLSSGLENLFSTLSTNADGTFGQMSDAAYGYLQNVENYVNQAQNDADRHRLGAGGASIYNKNFNGYASGTDYAPGGTAWVGERGPELVNLPHGSQVIPHDLTMGMLGGGGGSQAIHNHIHVYLDGNELAPSIAEHMARQTRLRYGSRRF